jgi:hypothetical protein
MPTKNIHMNDSLKTKIIRAILQIVQVVLIGVSIFLALVFAVGISAWLGNIQDLPYFITDAIFFLLFLCTLYVAYKIDRKLRPETKLTRNTIKQLGYLLAGAIAEFVFLYALDSYFKLFPATISATLTVEILTIVIQANGFLLGFSGIVFAQMFWALHNQQCGIQMKIIEDPFIPLKEKAFDIREDYLTVLERKRRSMIIYMFAVMSIFVISILLSLSGMAQTEMLETLPTNPYLIYPFLSMVAGILLFFFSIVQSKIAIQEEIKTTKSES